MKHMPATIRRYNRMARLSAAIEAYHHASPLGGTEVIGDEALPLVPEVRSNDGPRSHAAGASSNPVGLPFGRLLIASCTIAPPAPQRAALSAASLPSVTSMALTIVSASLL